MFARDLFIFPKNAESCQIGESDVRVLADPSVLPSGRLLVAVTGF